MLRPFLRRTPRRSSVCHRAGSMSIRGCPTPARPHASTGNSAERIFSEVIPNRRPLIHWPGKMPQILIVTGDAGESYEALYAVHRFREEDWRITVAAPSIRRLHLVMHDFEPGWDTYIERPGYGLEADASFDQINVDNYDAILILGGRAPEYLRNDRRLLDIVREFDAQQKWIFAICHGI